MCILLRLQTVDMHSMITKNRVQGSHRVQTRFTEPRLVRFKMRVHLVGPYIYIWPPCEPTFEHQPTTGSQKMAKIKVQGFTYEYSRN